MDAFFLAIIGVLLIAFAVYIIASIRIERSARSTQKNGRKAVRHIARLP